MKKLPSTLVIFAMLLFSASSWAQTPKNPFRTTENDGVFSDVKGTSTAKKAVTTAPIYKDTVTGGDILPVDPWASARDRSGKVTWRGSGRHGRLNYVGEATTYTDAQGQEMIAPEVNRNNMVVGLDHLRKLGYKIPAEYDTIIKKAPSSYKNKLQKAMASTKAAGDPFSRSLMKMMDITEKGTGLDLENIMFNSLRLLGTD
jgi:hypothetical protein